jgi:Protein of unknown function (DUF3800)
MTASISPRPSSILGNMAPTAIKIGLLTVLRAFYDGGNKADAKKYKVITLAGYAATDSIWARLDSAWSLALRRHGAEFIHMTDAISLQGAFSISKGWTRNRVEALILDLLKVFTEFSDKPIKGVACTIVLADYLRAKSLFADLPRPEYICTIDCLTLSWLWYASIPSKSDQLEDKCADLFFDRGESFMGHAQDVWNHKNFRDRKAFRAIRLIAPADMRDVPGIQMADMLAWAFNRPLGGGGYEDMCKSIRTAIPVWHRDLAFNELSDIDEDALERFMHLKFPRRRPM